MPDVNDGKCNKILGSILRVFKSLMSRAVLAMTPQKYFLIALYKNKDDTL